MSRLGDRLEAVRGTETKTAFAAELGVDRATYHRWLNGAIPLPSQLTRIAKRIGVDEAVLQADIGLAVDPDAMFAAIATRRDALRIYQNHIAALAAAIGLSSDASGVDVVVKTLREELLDFADGACAITVIPVTRGKKRKTLFHYQVAVVPGRWIKDGQPVQATLERVLTALRARVDEVLGPLLLPVTREHSVELVPGHLRGMCDLLLFPALLEPSSAPITAPRGGKDRDTLVLSVFQGGAPDVAAMLAASKGWAFSRVEHLARSTTRTGMGTISNAALHAALPDVLSMVLQQRATAERPTVWAIDHVAPLFGADALLRRLRDFEGQVVITALDDHGLDYAGGLVDQQGPPDPVTGHGSWRSLLEEWQEQLIDVVNTLNEERGGGGARTRSICCSTPTATSPTQCSRPSVPRRPDRDRRTR